ncbi:MAG: helix-turn-helix domain-containing protein [Pseudonocardiaceae bacterium]
MNGESLTPAGRYIEYGAVVAGPEAFLIARALRATVVAKFLAKARWFHGADVAQTISDIERAGRAWERSLDLARRDNAERANADTPESPTGWSVEKASNHLRLSRRRTQELACSGVLDGRRVGRRWVLDEASVRDYRQRKGER